MIEIKLALRSIMVPSNEKNNTTRKGFQFSLQLNEEKEKF